MANKTSPWHLKQNVPLASQTSPWHLKTSPWHLPWHLDRASIKQDSRALSYGGTVYSVPSRHPWLQGHSSVHD
ncbi:MAG TPA: hypothetical protein VN456_01210 [Desulfosporosinus sp.]|nr:hypothetical protein [Desulfosporosinus sp.]